MIVYDGFWQLLKKRGISQYELITRYGISPSVLYAMRHNAYLLSRTLERFCAILNCELYEICELVRDDELSKAVQIIKGEADSVFAPHRIRSRKSWNNEEAAP